LALFALAFQLAVSFGHVHLDGNGSDHSAEFATTSPAADTPSGLPDPARHQSGPDDCCPICALIHLAGATDLAQRPSLALPLQWVRLRAQTVDSVTLQAAPKGLFQARAPPIA
jgi:hypothetical protein